ncbi:YdcH family protein [Thermomonas sp.]|uniref:YdcH family protein n=1 Tax=Thermomonas sp. TaxID=1971895 RepID=UPI00261CF8FB|nr:YdcH family protein [Thermomonas sp.]
MLESGELARLTRLVMELREEHRDLDEAISRLQSDLQADELLLKRMKKRKLRLKDQIAWVENLLIPDEPA